MFDDILAKLKEVPSEHLRVAMLGKESDNWDDAMKAAGRCADVIFIFPEGLQIHEYKRLLNEKNCNVFICSEDYGEVAYHVENDGVNLIDALIMM